MAKFAVLLSENPTSFASMAPEQMQGIIERYKAWSDKVASQGQLIDGHKLADEGGRRLSREGGQLRVIDGPYAEAKEVIGGLFLVEAADYAAAVELIADCPHLDYGKIELRQIDETPEG